MNIIEPNIEMLALKYNIIELNTCVKPRVIEYLFEEKNADQVIYLDPDIKLFDTLDELQDKLANNSIILTAHIYTPIPFDGKTPGENSFLNYGLYNLGFIGLSKSSETNRFVDWWKNWTYQNGYIKVCDGLFVDQLPINLVPLFFKGVHILNHMGYNMAPWNLHERYLSFKGNTYWVNENEKLKFYHFSSFKVNSGELPMHHYNRFSIESRPDLMKIYTDYNEELLSSGYHFYNTLSCEYIIRQKKILEEKNEINPTKKSILKRILSRIRNFNSSL
jgi:hypothetical protein